MLVNKVNTVTKFNVREIYQLFIAFVIVMWLTFPVLMLPILIAIIGFVKLKNSLKIFFLFLVPITFASLNFSREPAGDLINYYTFFNQLYDLPFSRFYEVRGLQDLFFYGLSSLLIKISNNSPEFVLFVLTLIMYSVLILAVIKLGNLFGLSSRRKYACLAVVLFSTFPFTHSSHLVRQMLAMSFVVLAFAQLVNGEKKSLFTLFIASLSHFSSVIFLPSFLLILIKSQLFHKLLILLLATAALFFFFSGLSFYHFLDFSLVDRSDSYIYTSANVVSLTFYIQLLLSLTICIFIFFFQRSMATHTIKFVYIFSIFIFFIDFNNIDNLISQRIMLYGFGLISIAVIFVAKINNQMIGLIFWILYAVSYFRFLRVLAFYSSGYVQDGIPFSVLSLYRIVGI